MLCWVSRYPVARVQSCSVKLEYILHEIFEQLEQFSLFVFMTKQIISIYFSNTLAHLYVFAVNWILLNKLVNFETISHI